MSIFHIPPRDECRRRLVQGDFEVGGGAGGGGGGAATPLHKLAPPAGDSPVADMNSLLAGAHIQVGGGEERDREKERVFAAKEWGGGGGRMFFVFVCFSANKLYKD